MECFMQSVINRRTNYFIWAIRVKTFTTQEIAKEPIMFSNHLRSRFPCQTHTEWEIIQLSKDWGVQLKADNFGRRTNAARCPPFLCDLQEGRPHQHSHPRSGAHQIGPGLKLSHWLLFGVVILMCGLVSFAYSCDSYLTFAIGIGTALGDILGTS